MHDGRAFLHQHAGVRVIGMLKDVVKASAVHHMSAVHDQDAVSYFGDGAQVMGDEQHGGIFLLFDTDKFFQNLVLGDGIDGGGRLIGNQKLRLQGHGNADHDTLEHAAGKLVWVFFQNLFSVSDPHLFQNFQRAGADFLRIPGGVGGKGFCHLVSAASAAFHKVLRSAYSGGAWSDSMISVWTISLLWE